MHILITGGAGFIGSALVRHVIRHTPHRVLNVDKLTYAGDLTTVADVTDNPRYQHLRSDICDVKAIATAFSEFRPDAVVHLAAESHVDRSVDGPRTFVKTNVEGTLNMLEAARGHWADLAPDRKSAFRFLHVSTDEVFGSLGNTGLFLETTPYAPSSPYSASKAAADHLARAWLTTYGMPTMVSNCSNNFGPFQFPEKLIPLMILKAVHEEPLPVYGNGTNVRDWLHVEDHVAGLMACLERGQPGDSYNFGGNSERRNIDVVMALCSLLDERLPRESGASYSELIEYVTDRPGHDYRYAVCSDKAERELGWQREFSFESGLAQTVDWYLDHLDWCDLIRSTRYAGRRLGTGGITRLAS
jgi:dTDP-glucose 4,6-dehydratase